ncbi:SLIT-ROBO Rho GTPase-activating protein 1-like [Tachypleus tridentatus]|uniref:SLIT-ROBO Rho GTPase-activating protein 1-like n=1 Tax=Tachypleus tridentatus TaxID=6853 RepID=UPI003FD54CCE
MCLFKNWLEGMCIVDYSTSVLVLYLYDIRQQLNEQLKCLDVRMENQIAIVTEIQDFFRRRAEVEMEYSRSLEKLSKSLMLRHKAEKQKREQWHLFSSNGCWEQLVASTRQQSRDHAILSELLTTNITSRCTQIVEDVQRMYRRCREIGCEIHDELLKVLHELHTSMKTYQVYHGEERQADSKLRIVEAQRTKLAQSIPQEKLQRLKKYRLIVKEIQKRQSKYNDARLKSLKARNDYVLCLDAANAAVQKYFVDDISDLVDCMDFGFHTCLARTLLMYVSSEECLKKAKQNSIDKMHRCLNSLDSRMDKQKYFEYNNSAFMIPKKFEFQPHKGDEVNHVQIDKAIQEDLDVRHKQLINRLTSLKTESEEIWKTMETAEQSLLEMITAKDYDCSSFFKEEDSNKNGLKQPETLALKLRADRQETEDFYLYKFREYTFVNNLIARLQSKAELVRCALISSQEIITSESSSPQTIQRPHTLPHRARKKRIGQTPLVGQPKLFGGSLEEYLDVTNQEIPVIMKSCIRIINLYGLHHQGIFRVSGSQVEINNLKDAFERGEDPLADVSDASDINSVAGLLKLYLRELREPLFPIFFFEQFVEISRNGLKQEFISRVRDILSTLPRSVYTVLQYLFAFLNHLSEFSDENMMDPYNLAICFGPSLLPIPEDKDQVQYQSLVVNELIKNIIIYQEEIFPNNEGIVYEKYISANVPNDADVGESPPDQGTVNLDDSEADAAPSEDDVVFKEKEIVLTVFGKTDTLEGLAQHSFTARSDRELSFKRGDTLLLYEQVSNDWWKGSFNGQEGLIPDKYILIKIRDEDKDRFSQDGSEKRHSSTDSSSGFRASPKPCVDQRISEERAISPPHYSLNYTDTQLTLASTSSGQSMGTTHSSSGSQQRCALTNIQVSPIEFERNQIVHSCTTSEDVPLVKDLSSYDLQDEMSDSELAKDLDKALASVFYNIDSLEKEKHFKSFPQEDKISRSSCKDTPDLVMDLPVNASSPTSISKTPKETLGKIVDENIRILSPSDFKFSESQEMTTAEHFAKSNQCTMKKGTISRSAGSVHPPSTDAQTQTFPTVKRSASTNVDLMSSSSPLLSASPKKPVIAQIQQSSFSGTPSKRQVASQTEISKIPPEVPRKPVMHRKKMKVETVDITPGFPRHILEPKSSSNSDEDVSDLKSLTSGGVSTFKATTSTKIKPPVMKKPQKPVPSPETIQQIPEKEYRQTSF